MEAEEHKVIKEENRRLVAKLDRLENQPPRNQPVPVNRMPSAIQPTAAPLRPIYDMTSRNFSPTKSSTINDREPVINSSFKGTEFSKYFIFCRPQIMLVTSRFWWQVFYRQNLSLTSIWDFIITNFTCYVRIVLISIKKMIWPKYKWPKSRHFQDNRWRWWAIIRFSFQHYKSRWRSNGLSSPSCKFFFLIRFLNYITYNKPNQNYDFKKYKGVYVRWCIWFRPCIILVNVRRVYSMWVWTA